MKKVILFLMMAVLCMSLCSCGKADQYETAVALMDSGEYEKAIEVLAELRDYKDSIQKLEECENILAYLEAEQLFEDGRYAEALAVYTELEDFEDSIALAQECEKILSYYEAVDLMKSGEYRQAAAILAGLGDYEDSAQRLEDCNRTLTYEAALESFNAGAYEEALAAFTELGEYADSALKAQECETALAYGRAVALMEAGAYAEAAELFSALDDYEKSDDYRKLCTTKMMLDDPLYLELVDILGVEIPVDALDFGAVVPNSYGNGKTEIYFELKNNQLPADAYIFEMGNNCQVRIPTTYGELYEMGWRVEETNWQAKYDIREAKLNDLYPAGEMIFCDMRNGSGKKMHITLMNDREEPVELQAVTVMGCDSEMEGISVNGITQGSTVAEIINAFGWPALVHSMYGAGFESITFYYHDSEPAGTNITISINAETGRMTYFAYTSWPE